MEMSENHSLSSPVETPRSQLWRAGKPAQLKPLIITQVGCWLVYDKWDLHCGPWGLFVYFHPTDFCHCQCTLSMREILSILLRLKTCPDIYFNPRMRPAVLILGCTFESPAKFFLVSVVSTVVSTFLFQYWRLDLIPGKVGSNKKKRKKETVSPCFWGKVSIF